MSRPILIVCKVIDEFLHDLESVGFELDYRPNCNREEALTDIHHFEGLIIRSKFRVDRDLLDAASRLSFVGRVGSGLENIDLEYARQRGVNVYRSPEGNAAAVAEHAIGMILGLLNKFPKAEKMIRSFNWDREAARGTRLESKVIGLIGYGHVAREVARRLECFNVQILAYDKYLSEGRHCVEMIELFERAQIISLHVPLTSETYHLINDEFISKMKNPFYLINTSRGKVVSTKALIRAMTFKKVLGAALDVFENEKMESLTKKERELMQRLCAFEDVILSPHVAGWNDYSKQALHSVLFKKIVDHES